MSTYKNFRIALIVVGLVALPLGQAVADDEDEYEAAKWKEVEFQLPTPPKEQNLIPVYVSAAAENRFFVDSTSISVGSDGIVRYTLLVVTQDGVRNVSYEGMRCETRERRFYASGRPDGTWSKSRNNRWARVQESAYNRYHAALFQDCFCPDGVIVRNADEARGLLRRSGRPSSAGG